MEPKIRVLVVEDDDDINQLLSSLIRRNGYVAQSAYSGTEAKLYLESQAWDLVLLDLMLPGMDGEALLAYIGERYTMPVLIISAKSEQRTKIEALYAGADDYITKPFDNDEVLARVDAALRRYRRSTEGASSPLLHHGGLTVDTETMDVSLYGQALQLTAREYEILTLLLASPKKVFTKANLYERVWKEEYYGDDNTISVHISNLRSKLAKIKPDEEFIETVWGVGYRLKT